MPTIIYSNYTVFAKLTTYTVANNAKTLLMYILDSVINSEIYYTSADNNMAL